MGAGSSDYFESSSQSLLYKVSFIVFLIHSSSSFCVGYQNQLKLAQAFIKSILRDYEAVLDIDDMDNGILKTNGMNVLRNVIDIETGKSGNVVVRNIAKNFWLKVIEATNTNRVCALGTPGIGKTTTTCILIRLLLQQKETVVYRVRRIDKDGFVYMFTPRMESSSVVVDIRVIREYKFDHFDTNIYQKNIYYVVDPGQTKTSCDPCADYIEKVIVVASPDERHWGRSSFSNGIFLCYPAWSLSDLLASLPYITKSYKLDASSVKDRFHKFGGVPRYIFTEDVKSNEMKLQRALQGLTIDTAISLSFRTRCAIKTRAKDLSKGILLSYVLSDNDNGSFQYKDATLCSDYVYEFITTRYMGRLWKQMVLNDGIFDPYLFVTYCAILLCENKERSAINFTVRDITTQSANNTNIQTISLNQCIGKEHVYDVAQAARDISNTIFVPISAANKLIDFVYRDGNTYHCFCCLIGTNHSIEPEHIYQFVLDVLNKSEEDTWDSMTLDDLPLIRIYYAVPAFRFKSFCTTPPNAIVEAMKFCKQCNKRKRGNSLFDLWHSIVSAHILSVDQPPKIVP